MWVPRREQNQQGAILASFVQNQRVLDGAPYWVEV